MANVQEVNAGNWEKEVVESNILTLVDFWHDHCPWCLRLNPVIDEVSDEYQGRVKFTKLNVLANPDNRETAVRYGVMGTPTVIFFCGGRPVDTAVGFIAKEKLKSTIEDMLSKHKECIMQSTELKT